MRRHLTSKIRLSYPIIGHNDIVVGSLFFHKVYAKPDGGWPPHCYVQYIVGSNSVINGLCCVLFCSYHFVQLPQKMLATTIKDVFILIVDRCSLHAYIEMATNVTVANKRCFTCPFLIVLPPLTCSCTNTAWHIVLPKNTLLSSIEMRAK